MASTLRPSAMRWRVRRRASWFPRDCHPPHRSSSTTQPTCWSTRRRSLVRPRVRSRHSLAVLMAGLVVRFAFSSCRLRALQRVLVRGHAEVEHGSLVVDAVGRPAGVVEHRIVGCPAESADGRDGRVMSSTTNHSWARVDASWPTSAMPPGGAEMLATWPWCGSGNCHPSTAPKNACALLRSCTGRVK